MGCDVIDKIFNRGFEKGLKIGMEQMRLLIRNLFAQNRIDDIRKACNDKEYRMQLLKEFGIIQDACTRSPSSACPKTS